MTPTISYQRTRFDDERFQALIKELDQEFWVRYPDTQQNFEPYNKVDESARVIIATWSGQAIGCGCFRPRPGSTVEIKRMYVKPSQRGQGIAKILLQQLEAWAISEGYGQAILETGIRQPEAIHVYQHSGYRVIPNFPPYENIQESICMAKMLTTKPSFS